MSLIILFAEALGCQTFLPTADNTVHCSSKLFIALSPQARDATTSRHTFATGRGMMDFGVDIPASHLHNSSPVLDVERLARRDEDDPGFLAVSPQVTLVINPVVGCHCFLPGPRAATKLYCLVTEAHGCSLSSWQKATTQWCPARTRTRDLSQTRTE